jgi:hypothetical protein
MNDRHPARIEDEGGGAGGHPFRRQEFGHGVEHDVCADDDVRIA